MARFGIELTEGQIGNFKHNYHIKSGTHGGRFPKGHPSHNKNKPMSPETYRKAAATMFKPGHQSHNRVEVGSIRTDVDGYVKIKIAEPNKWQQMQRHIMEKKIGRKLTKNEVVIFLDGNKQNMSIDNLMLITKRELCRINQNHRITDNPELTKTGIYIEKLKEKIRDGV